MILYIWFQSAAATSNPISMSSGFSASIPYSKSDYKEVQLKSWNRNRNCGKCWSRGAAYYEQGNFNLTVKWREWSWLINDIYLLSFGVTSFVNRELDSQIDWAFYCNDEWLREKNNRFETVIMQLLNSFDPYSLCVMASNCSNYSINQYNVGIAFYQPVADYRSHICPFS